MQFGPGETITSTETPIEGVTIHRDNFGIPHIYADNLDHASYGLGYVTAQDRMFEMDAFRLRRAGRWPRSPVPEPAMPTSTWTSRRAGTATQTRKSEDVR